MFKMILPKFIFEIERWKWNKEYRVYVSNMGHILDEHKKPLPILFGGGYMTVRLNRNTLKPIHRLVLLTWRPIPNAEDLTIDHLDSNKRNNKLTNLEWVTREENQKRAKVKIITKQVVKELKIEDPIYKVKGGDIIFNNINKATNYIINRNFHNDKEMYKTAKRKIKEAIATNTKYCGVYWKEIKEV